MVSYTRSTGILLTLIIAALAVHTGEGALKGTALHSAHEEKHSGKVKADATPRRRASKAFEVRPPHERQGYRSLFTLDLLFEVLIEIKLFFLGLLGNIFGGGDVTVTIISTITTTPTLSTLSRNRNLKGGVPLQAMEAPVDDVEDGAAWLVPGGIHESRRLKEAVLDLGEEKNHA